MERLLGAFVTVADTTLRWDDDLVDRMNHRYTTFLLIIFAIVVSTKQYVGEPINCWCPAQFTDNHEDFANKICWVQNTYYVPITQKRIPEPDEEHARISYYQWVPLILLTQAVLFYVPCLIWRFMNNKSGIDLNNLVQAAITLQHGSYQEQREKTLQYCARHIDRYLETVKDRKRGCLRKCKHFLSRNCFLFCGKRYANYVIVLYLACKILFLVNVISQLFLLNAFLGTNYHAYGYDILVKMFHNENWNASDRFPRVTLCDFHIRKLGNIHRYTVQCVLPINLFNEKIYIFIWFWFVFDAVVTFFNIIIWVFRVSFQRQKVNYVRRRLSEMMKQNLPKQEKEEVSKFTLKYLRMDGLLVLRLIGLNANEIVVGEIVRELWRNFKAKGYLYNTNPSAPLMHNGMNGMTGRGMMGREQV